MAAPLLTPNAVVLVAIDFLARHAQLAGTELSRSSWIRQALIEELVRELPRESRAGKAVRRLTSRRIGVSESAADAVFFDLALNGWLIPLGVHGEATWEIDISRHGEIQSLWASLTEPEQRGIEKAVQRTLAVSVAWSKKLRARSESSSPTSRSSTP